MVNGRVLYVRWTNLLAFNSLELRNARSTRKGLVDESLVLDPGVVSEVDREAVVFLLVNLEACADEKDSFPIFAFFAFFVVPFYSDYFGKIPPTSGS